MWYVSMREWPTDAVSIGEVAAGTMKLGCMLYGENDIVSMLELSTRLLRLMWPMSSQEQSDGQSRVQSRTLSRDVISLEGKTWPCKTNLTPDWDMTFSLNSLRMKVVGLLSSGSSLARASGGTRAPWGATVPESSLLE